MVRAAGCRSAGPWFKSRCALLATTYLVPLREIGGLRQRSCVVGLAMDLHVAQQAHFREVRGCRQVSFSLSSLISLWLCV